MMANETAAMAEEIRDGVVQLRFVDKDDQVRDINAAQVAETLRGLVEFTDDMAKKGLFGDGIPPEVRVRVPKQGSFVIEAIVHMMNTEPATTVGVAMTTGGAIVGAINLGIRRLRGYEPSNVQYLDNGNVMISWPNGGVQEVPREAWKRLNEMKRPTRKALAKIMAPMSDDVDRVEIRDAEIDDTTEEVLATPPDVVAERSDYREAVHEEDEVSESSETFVVEAMLQSIDFRPGEKWRVSTTRGSRLATMDDEEFLQGLEHGEPLHKNDIFEATIRETRTTTNGRTATEWSLIKVRLTRRGEDGDDADAPRSPRD